MCRRSQCGQAASGMSKDATALSRDIGLPRQPIEPEKDVLRIIDGLFRAIGDRQRNIPGIGQAARDPIVGRELALLGASGGDDNSRVGPWVFGRETCAARRIAPSCSSTRSVIAIGMPPISKVAPERAHERPSTRCC